MTRPNWVWMPFADGPFGWAWYLAAALLLDSDNSSNHKETK